MKIYFTFKQHFEIIRTKVVYPPIIDDRIGKYSNVPLTHLHKETFYYEISKKYISRNEYIHDSENYIIDEVKVDLDLLDEPINFSNKQKRTILKKINSFKEMVGFINKHATKSKFSLNTKKEKTFNFKMPIYCGVIIQNEHFEIGEYKLPLKSNQEIEYFENLLFFFEEKNLIEKKSKLSNNHIFIKWSNVEFLNGKIIINVEKKLYEIPFAKSSLHHERMKCILFKNSNEGLLVEKLENNYKIVDLMNIENLIVFFNLHINLNNLELNTPELTNISQGLSFSKSDFVGFFSKDLYIDKLIKIQSTKFGVIPVYEPNNKNDELSYIFTMKRKSKIYLIWENICDARATYIFQSSQNNYSKDIQTLYDYIKSNIRRKRIGIYDYVSQLKNKGIELNFLKKVIHTNFLDWEKKFTQL